MELGTELTIISAVEKNIPYSLYQPAILTLNQRWFAFCCTQRTLQQSNLVVVISYNMDNCDHSLLFMKNHSWEGLKLVKILDAIDGTWTSFWSYRINRTLRCKPISYENTTQSEQAGATWIFVEIHTGRISEAHLNWCVLSVGWVILYITFNISKQI